MRQVKIVLEDLPEGEDLIFITGFHGIGYVGFLATRYLVTTLKAKKIGYVEASIEPLFTSSTQSGGVYVPFEIYCFENLMFFCANYGFTSRVELRILDYIARWVSSMPFTCAIMFGGLDSRLRKTQDVGLRLAATSEFVKRFRNWIRAPLLEEGLWIVGPLARLLVRFEEYSFPAVAILPYAEIMRPDPYAASVGISYLKDILKIEVDLSKLLESAEAIEREIEELKKRWERLQTEKMTYM